MDIEHILKNDYHTEKHLGEAFYDTASQEENSTLIKKLFLKLDYRNKLTSSVLTYGILGCLEFNQEKNLTIISQFMDKNNIKFDNDILTNALTHPLEGKEELSFSAISKFMINNHVQPDRTRMVDYALNLLQSDSSVNPIMEFWDKTGVKDTELPYLQTIYNFAVDNKKHIIAQSLNQQFDIIKNSLKQDMGEDITFMDGAHSSWGSLNADGTLSMCGAAGGALDNLTQRRIDYQINPILLNLQSFNHERLGSFFKQSTEISTSLVLHAVVRSIVFNNDNAVEYLFSQPQCAKIIKDSSDIQNFITSNNDTDLENNKAQARLCLAKLLNDKEIKSKYKL